MKKLITLSALAFTLCFLFSCTKDNQSLSTSSAKQNGSTTGSQDGPRMSPTPVAHPDVVGDWVSLKLEQVSNGSNNALHGRYIFNNPLTLDYNYDVKLVFIRIGQESTDVNPDPNATPVMVYNYKALPTDMMSSTGKVHFAFLLSTSAMDVGIASVNPSVMPNAADFAGLQYRYFIVTRATYFNNSIDWTDYNAVVAVLNTAP